MPKHYTSVEEYLAGQPKEMQQRLEDLRQTIKKTAPQAIERISYNMPAYDQKGILVYFAARKGYTGFYPTASGVKAFLQETTEYETSKGAIHFPLDRPLPKILIAKIVRYRLKENLEKTGRKT